MVKHAIQEYKMLESIGVNVWGKNNYIKLQQVKHNHYKNFKCWLPWCYGTVRECLNHLVDDFAESLTIGTWCLFNFLESKSPKKQKVKLPCDLEDSGS